MMWLPDCKLFKAGKNTSFVGIYSSENSACPVLGIKKSLIKHYETDSGKFYNQKENTLGILKESAQTTWESGSTEPSDNLVLRK